jgi:hypothetical protein
LSILPNPTVDEGRIDYTIARSAANVTIELFDMFGRHVAIVADGPHAAGSHTARLDVESIPSGTYHCRMTIGGETILVRRVVVAR